MQDYLVSMMGVLLGSMVLTAIMCVITYVSQITTIVGG